MAQQTAVDFTYLDQLRSLAPAGAPDLAVRVIRIFLKNAPDLIRTIGESAVQGSFDEVSLLAHRLKSSAMNVGAQQMIATLNHLETLDVSKRPEAPALVTQLEAEFDAVQRVLSQREGIKEPLLH